MARPDRIVYDIVKSKAAELGIPMGQYVADVLAEHTGHPELVRELNKHREVLPLAMRRRGPGHRGPGRCRHLHSGVGAKPVT